MARVRQTLEAWIQECLTDTDKEGKVTIITLVHMQGTTQKEVHTCKFGNKAWPAAELAKMFQAKSESYAQDLSGAQTFQLLVFYGKSEPEATHPFIVNGTFNLDGGAGNGLGTESPTATGTLAQGMRLTEAIVQRTFGQIQLVFETSQRALDRNDARIAHLETENREMFSIFKEMMMAKVLDDRKFKLDQLNHARDTEERKKWMSFAPALINTLLGKEIFPQSIADTALVETIADNIKEEDIQKLAGVLPPELWGPLAVRMKAHIDKRLAEKAERERQMKELPPHPDPEADAAGDAIEAKGDSIVVAANGAGLGVKH